MTKAASRPGFELMAVLINGICFHYKEPLGQSDMLFGRQLCLIGTNYLIWMDKSQLVWQGSTFFLNLTPHAYLGHTHTRTK